MKFLCNKEDMRNVAALASNIITQKNSTQIISCILLEAGAKKITVSTTNREVSFKTHFYANVEKEGAAVVNARALNDILREMPNIELAFESSKKGIEIKSTDAKDKFSFDLLCMAREDFPQIPSFPKDNRVNIAQKKIKEMIQKTLPIVSDEESRYSIPGVLFEIKNGLFRMVTTSTTILSLIEHELPAAGDLECRIIVPTKALQEVLKSIGTEGDCQIAFNEKQVFFSYNNIFVSSSLLQKSFPNYSIIVDTKQEKSLAVKKEPFIKALKRVSVLADEKLQMIDLIFDNGAIAIKSENKNLGKAEDAIAADYQDEKMEICFSSGHLMNVVQEISHDVVVMEFNTAITPVKVKSPQDDYYIFIIMPMRKTST